MKHPRNPFINAATIAAISLPLGLGICVHAADFTWGGGTLDWSDTTASGWNGGPPGGGDTATINSGTVTLTANNLPNSLASVTIGGTGKLTQTTGNTWGAFNNLTLSGGTLEAVRASGDAFGAYQISNTAYVTGTSASTINTNGAGSIFINLGLAVNDSPTFTTFDVSDVTSGSATDLTVSTVLANNIATNFSSFSAAGLIKTGAGTMTLSANNAYTGGTTVNHGVLEISGSSGGNGYIRGSVTVNSGAELHYTGGDGTGFGFTGGNKIDTLNINGGLVDSQNTAHLYGATVNMTSGELRVNGGVSNPLGNQIHWDNTTVNTVASASAATISGRINLRGDAGFTNAVFSVADGSAATDLLVSAAVTESGGTVGLTKHGAGIMELSSTNSYTGATTVSAGTLLVTGALGNSTVSVNDGAFGGTGTVGGSLSLNSGFFHVSNLFDPLDVTGTITLFSGFGVDDLAGLDWGSVANGTYTLITGTLGVGVFDALANNSIGSAYDIDGLSGSRSAYFQNGSLQLVVVPEPRAAFLGSLGLLMLLRRRKSF